MEYMDKMIPWERHIYMKKLEHYLKQVEEKRKQAENARKNKSHY